MNEQRRSTDLIVSIILIVVIIGLDQVSKLLVCEYVKPVGSISILSNVLSFTYVENYGAAFGILKSERWFFIIVSLIMILAFMYLLFFKKVKNKWLIASSVLLIGGGVGNLIDRIFKGYVIDFISLSFFKPVCNLVDYFITAGAVCLIMYIVFFYKETEQKEVKEAK